MNIHNLLGILPQLDKEVIGYGELKQSLLSACWKRARGLRGHVLVFGPPGVGKTHILKTFARLAGQANSGQMIYARTQGRADLMPEEILAERIVEYSDSGQPGFVYRLGVVEALRHNGSIPALWHFDEIDKVPARTLNALLELMEEQQLTLPNRQRVDLNFLLVATANGRKYDPTAQALGRALRDRFSAEVEVFYLPLEDDLQMLKLHVGQWQLPIWASEEMLEGLVKAVKLTQQTLAGYTDFKRHIKVPAGPRGILNLFQEAAAEAIFQSEISLQPGHVISVGKRVLRGRLEVTAESEIAGKPADVLIADILHEVFGGIRQQQAPAEAAAKITTARSAEEKSEEQKESEDSDDQKNQAESKDSGDSADEKENAESAASADKKDTEEKEESDGSENSSESNEPDDSSKLADDQQDADQGAGKNGEYKLGEKPKGLSKPLTKPTGGQAHRPTSFLAGFRQAARDNSNTKPKSEQAEDVSQDQEEADDPFASGSSSQQSDKDGSSETGSEKTDQKEADPSKSSNQASDKSDDQIEQKEGEQSDQPDSSDGSPSQDSDQGGEENKSDESPENSAGSSESNNEQQSDSGQSANQSGEQSGEAGQQTGSQPQTGDGNSQSKTGESNSPGSGASQSQKEGQTASQSPGGNQGQASQSAGKGNNGSSPSGQPGQQGKGQTGGHQGGEIRSIIDTAALAKLLAEQMASKLFATREGKKTGAELAQELAQGKRLDFRADDGSLEAQVRGDKTIAKGKAEKIQKALEIQKDRSTATGQGGGGLASKTNEFVSLLSSSLPPDLASILPQLREIGDEGVIEVLRGWIEAPAKSRVKGGAEHRLLKGVAHLSALKAQREFEEVRDGEQTLTRSGERTDFTVGRNLLAPLNPVKTMIRMVAAGGVYDDKVEVREIRVTCDAPHLIFVIDASGSMANGNRMLCAIAAAQATAEYYGPRGATLGLIILTGEDPIIMVRPPETDAEKVIDGILSLEPTYGTAYAPAMELAFRAALPKTTVMVIGDFEDSGELGEDALALKSEKDIKTIALLAESGEVEYAAKLCDEVHMVDLSDPTSVALVTLKAAE